MSAIRNLNEHSEPPDSPSVEERLNHVLVALLLGKITKDEAAMLRRMIQRGDSPLGRAVDIYCQFSIHPQDKPGAWIIVTPWGEKPLGWFKRMYEAVMNPE